MTCLCSSVWRCCPALCSKRGYVVLALVDCIVTVVGCVRNVLGGEISFFLVMLPFLLCESSFFCVPCYFKVDELPKLTEELAGPLKMMQVGIHITIHTHSIYTMLTRTLTCLVHYMVHHSPHVSVNLNVLAKDSILGS